MMYSNENLPNPFQQLFDKMCALERKVDELIKEKGSAKSEQPQDELMTVQSATEYLRISASTLYQFTSRKEIPFMKKGKRLYFKKEDLRQWVEGGSCSPSSEQEKQLQALSHLRPVKRRKLR